MLKVFLVLYVDDFKLAGPRESMQEVWKLIRKDIVTGDPQPLAHFLGCTHEPVRFTPEGSSKEVTGQLKNMEGFFRKNGRIPAKTTFYVIGLVHEPEIGDLILF